MNNHQVEKILIEHLVEDAGLDPDISVDDSLISSGVLDSFDIVALSSFAGEKFSIVVKPLEVNLDNFESISKIASFITSKMAQGNG